MGGLSLGLSLGLTSMTGGSVPNPVVNLTIMRDSYVMRDSIRMTSNA